MLVWKKEFETGVYDLDNQHKHLFEIGNKAYSLLDTKSDKYDEIVAIIGELKEYAIYHFNAEEEFMKKIGYRKFLSHKVEHDDFVAKLEKIDLNQLEENQEVFLKDLLMFVFEWITNHILEKDMGYSFKKE